MFHLFTTFTLASKLSDLPGFLNCQLVSDLPAFQNLSSPVLPCLAPGMSFKLHDPGLACGRGLVKGWQGQHIIGSSLIQHAGEVIVVAAGTTFGAASPTA